ncbi:hypothetical protein [Rhizobium sp. NFR07]|uniref:hypothetical protein n=1 Tax=Rhizobium sp. NFR07 TaxID=1566262 RepID=UPI000B85F024|nr:hypothetical protein [Rhizobium sp. NFR07]
MMRETIVARLKRWKTELDMARPSEGQPAPVSALSQHISKVRATKHQMQGEQVKTGDVDGTDESH